MSASAVAAGKLPVPSVIDTGDDEGMAWMLLGPLPGTDGTDPPLFARPERLVRMLANALRQLHDFPPTACPFDFRLPTAVTHVESRLRGGQIDTTQFQIEYARHTPETAVLALRRDLPAAEDLVITHGDYCVPNIVLDGDRLSGFVDVGALGVADRWRDLAVAIWSIERNIGHGWEDLFFRHLRRTTRSSAQAVLPAAVRAGVVKGGSRRSPPRMQRAHRRPYRLASGSTVASGFNLVRFARQRAGRGGSPHPAARWSVRPRDGHKKQNTRDLVGRVLAAVTARSAR